MKISYHNTKMAHEIKMDDTTRKARQHYIDVMARDPDRMYIKLTIDKTEYSYEFPMMLGSDEVVISLKKKISPLLKLYKKEGVVATFFFSSDRLGWHECECCRGYSVLATSPKLEIPLEWFKYTMEKPKAAGKADPTCPICLDTSIGKKAKKIQFLCGHWIHKPCYESMIKSRNDRGDDAALTCPYCRQVIVLK